LRPPADLAPRLAQRAAQAESLRRCPQETLDELRDSGLLRMMQPARFGGSELGLDTLFNVVMELSKGCASTAWTYSNLASHNWNVGQLELQAQIDVWGEDPDACVATGLAFPCGRATRSRAAIALSGRWPFASGVDASTWMIVGALTEQPPAPPERRFFLVPETGFRTLDNWQALGLSGTGSHDVEIDDVVRARAPHGLGRTCSPPGSTCPAPRSTTTRCTRCRLSRPSPMCCASSRWARPRPRSSSSPRACARAQAPTPVRGWPSLPRSSCASPRPRPASSSPKP
jgi:alkylation response protein AidB-like acyl-CoA dehydrogenase